MANQQAGNSQVSELDPRVEDQAQVGGPKNLLASAEQIWLCRKRRQCWSLW